MDYLRSGYRTRARLIDGSETTGFIRWYQAMPGAKVFPHRHAFGSSVWEGDHRQEWEGPGETSRTRTWSPKIGPPLPGDHFHGEASWFLHGVPPEVAAGPPSPYDCDQFAQRGKGGAAGGGSAFGGVQLGRGGAAGGGNGFARIQRGRGGAAGGGKGFQPGGPYRQLGRGGAAAGGHAPQTGDPYVQFSEGGAAGGGVGDQTAGGIETPCCGSTPIPSSTHYTFSGSTDPAGNVSVELEYNPVSGEWESGPFTMGTEDGYELVVRCSGTLWQVQIEVDGTPFILLIRASADCGPPHDVLWNFVTTTWPGLSAAGPTTGNWTP